MACDPLLIDTALTQGLALAEFVGEDTGRRPRLMHASVLAWGADAGCDPTYKFFWVC